MKNKAALFWTGAVFTLVAPLLVGILSRNPTTLWVVALCGAFVTVLTKIDDLVEVSLGPVRAKMRETIREATATIEQLRAVAASIAEVALTDLMASNFMGGTTLKTRLELHDKIIQTLKDIGVSERHVQTADGAWRKGIGLIYHRIIRRHLEGHKDLNVVNEQASPERLAASREFQELLDFPAWQAPSPAKMASFISEKGFMDDTLREWISDYQHFVEVGEIRRRDSFVSE